MEPSTPPPSRDISAGNINVEHGNVHVGPVYHQSPAPNPQSPLFVGVPGLPAHEIVGRDAQLASLRARLVGRASLSLTALEGQGGVGKTTLALLVAHDAVVRAHFPDGVLWASLGKQPDVLAALAAWGEALGRDVSHYPTEVARSRAIQDTIGQRRMLLVVDDAWSQEAALRLRCGGPACAHLLTTRDRDVASAFAPVGVETVAALDDANAWALLQTMAPAACKADPNAARALARAVGGLPLALTLLGGYLAATENSQFPSLAAEALAEMGDPARRLYLASERLGAGDGRTVMLLDVIDLSLADLPEETRRAFVSLGAFAPKPATFDKAAAEAVTESDARTLARLVRRNLLEAEGETLTLHQALHDFACHLHDPGSTERHRAYYLALANADRKDWRRIDAAYPQLQWAWAHLPDEAVLGYISAVGGYHNIRGLNRGYISWATRGLNVARRQGLLKQEGTLLYHIGLTHDRLGELEVALTYLQAACKVQERTSDPLELASTLNALGVVYKQLAKWLDAEECFNQALSIFKDMDSHKDIAGSLNSIGSLYGAQRQYERALTCYYEALTFLRGDDQEMLALTYTNIGFTHVELGVYEEAWRWYGPALPIFVASGDREKERQIRYNIAMLHRAEGRLVEAVAQLRRVVELDEQVEHPDLGSDQAMLAKVEKEWARRGKPWWRRWLGR